MNEASTTQNVGDISPRALKLLVISASCFALASGAVTLRLWARRIKGCHLCFNDYAILAAWLFAVGDCVTVTMSILVGKIGHHSTDLTLSEISVLSKTIVTAETLRISANSCVKLSIMHLYLRIFPNKDFRYIVYGVMALTISYWGGAIVPILLLCSPRAYLWDSSNNVNRTCLNVSAVCLTASVINLILDVVVLGLPMPLLWTLQMPLSKRIAVMGVFGMGAVVCTITILRIISLLQLNFSDLSYNIITTTIWGCLEPCIGIMSACLPILPPLIARLFKCTNTLIWLRDRRPSMISHPTTTTTLYNTTTWPGTGTGTPAPPTPKLLRPVRKKQQSSHVRFDHRLYDVGNLLGNPSPPPHPVPGAGTRSPAPALLANDYDEEREEKLFSCMEMENQSDPESLRKIRISKGWHRSKAGTSAPPSSPRG